MEVLYGSEDGPGDRRTKLTQNSAGVPGTNEEGDQFGQDLAAGDVNADGFADIAVGVGHEDIPQGEDNGAVVLLKGSRGGLSGAGSQAFDQAGPGVPGAAEAGDRFGSAVLLQDTDGDGHSDLALGTPGEDGATLTDTGAVWVLRGAPAGLTTDGVVSFGPGALGAPEADAHLGEDFAD